MQFGQHAVASRWPAFPAQRRNRIVPAPPLPRKPRPHGSCGVGDEHLSPYDLSTRPSVPRTSVARRAPAGESLCPAGRISMAPQPAKRATVRNPGSGQASGASVDAAPGRASASDRRPSPSACNGMPHSEAVMEQTSHRAGEAVPGLFLRARKPPVWLVSWTRPTCSSVRAPRGCPRHATHSRVHCRRCHRYESQVSCSSCKIEIGVLVWAAVLKSPSM